MSRTKREHTDGKGACQFSVGGKICGETHTLDIVHEFKQLYEDKIREIDNIGGGDCAEVRHRENLQNFGSGVVFVLTVRK